jgi:hypothetical protein
MGDMKLTYKDLKSRLTEAKEPPKKVYYTFGRFNPPTKGHLENLDYLFDQEGDHFAYVSHSVDSDKNPLSIASKIEILKAARPEYADRIFQSDTKMHSVFQINEYLKSLGYNSITLVVGEDRVNDFKYEFKDGVSGVEFNVISSGKRKSGISGTAMRKFVVDDDFASYKSGMGDSVPDKLIKKSFDEIKSKLVNEATQLRDNFLSGKIFKIGSIVESKLDKEYYEIIDRGTSYLRLVDTSGNIKRSWLSDVVEIFDNQIKESFITKKKANNQITFKGYTTVNFDKRISESFSKILNSDDVYAVLSAIKHTDKFFTDKSLAEKYEHYSKSEHYLNVLGVIKDHNYRDLMESIIAEKMIADIPSIKQITKSDKQKTANIILAAIGIEFKGTAEEKINAAAKEVSKNVSSDLREIYGSLFQLADDVGIEWDRNIFTHGQRKDLGILESLENHEAFIESITENIKYFDDIICLYEKKELVIVDSSGNESELPDDEDIEDAIENGLKSDPTSSNKEGIAKQILVKTPSTNFEVKAKNLALRYLRDRQLRTTLNQMSDKERRSLEKILNSKGSVITNASKKLIKRLEEIESKKVNKQE